jgi:hypothetical protein
LEPTRSLVVELLFLQDVVGLEDEADSGAAPDLTPVSTEAPATELCWSAEQLGTTPAVPPSRSMTSLSGASQSSVSEELNSGSLLLLLMTQDLCCCCETCRRPVPDVDGGAAVLLLLLLLLPSSTAVEIPSTAAADIGPCDPTPAVPPPWPAAPRPDAGRVVVCIGVVGGNRTDHLYYVYPRLEILLILTGSAHHSRAKGTNKLCKTRHEVSHVSDRSTR